jgi:fluoride ion exporter CrcB/FEX
MPADAVECQGKRDVSVISSCASSRRPIGCLPHQLSVFLFAIDWHDRYSTVLKASVLTGLLGGYTTFSTMQLDAAKLAEKRHGVLAASYLLLQVGPSP